PHPRSLYALRATAFGLAGSFGAGPYLYLAGPASCRRPRPESRGPAPSLLSGRRRPFGLTLRTRGLGASALREDRVHLVPFLPRGRLGDGHLGEVFDQPLEDPPPDPGVGHLA